MKNNFNSELANNYSTYSILRSTALKALTFQQCLPRSNPTKTITATTAAAAAAATTTNYFNII